MHNVTDYADLVEAVLAKAAREADEAEVYLSVSDHVSLELRRSQVGEAEKAVGWALGIRTITDGHIGASMTMSPARWEDCLAAALASGRIADPQAWGGLPEPVQFSRETDVFDSSLVPDADTATDLITALCGAAEGGEAEIAGGGVSLGRGSALIANTHGIFYTREATSASASLEVINGTSTGYEFDHVTHLGDLNTERVAEEAVFLADYWAGAGDVDSCTADIILTPTALSQLIGGILMPALSGRNVHAGRSYLADKKGEPCMDPSFVLYDDPYVGNGATRWDADGVATRRLDFIGDGTVQSFAYDLRTAYRYGQTSTGSAVRSGAGGAPEIGVHCLKLDARRDDVRQEKAISAHGLIGAHTANTITGDFSVELSNAAWVEDGEYGAPIRSAMLSGNLFAMLADIAGAGEEKREIGRMTLPEVRFKNLHVIGK
ncbi:TldD/PmbA family protein [Methanogenium sp. S4BF]|uniref:TldD/PmbA family protein n=1 Tax=Methanogenium sp. S4BF TaxID=1789226 RepID=UPI00241691D0|nr:TldD/PmbA family protein [Methanogenium sp. S4BF]WFN33891.1 TldD/PmbA family protein [Methanogenium sp. S4BF]